MSNELQYYGDPVVDTGLTVVARVYNSSGVQVGSDVATNEVGSLAIYRGDMPVAVEGNYGVRFFSGTLLLGQSEISWDGAAERTILGNATPTNVSDAQTAIQSDLSAKPTLAQMENLGVNIQQVNGYDVDGEGTESQPWGPI